MPYTEKVMLSTTGAISVVGVGIQVSDYSVNKTVGANPIGTIAGVNEKAVGGAVGYSGTVNGYLDLGSGAVFGPFQSAVSFSAYTAGGGTVAPSLEVQGYDVTIEQDVRPIARWATSSTAPVIAGNFPTLQRGTWSVSGYMDTNGQPWESANYKDQQFIAAFHLTDNATITFTPALIQSQSLTRIENCCEAVLSGRNGNGTITCNNSTAVNLTSSNGVPAIAGTAAFTFTTGKSVSGEIIFTRITFRKDASNVAVSADFVNRAEMAEVGL